MPREASLISFGTSNDRIDYLRAFMSLRGLALQVSVENKKLGRFYTPQTVAQALADWAVFSSNCTVLDPSFGGCAFLKASLNSLARMRSFQPQRLIFGVDLDPGASGYLSDLLRIGARSSQFRTGDFLKIHPNDMPMAPYDVVLGNPPYVRHHKLEDKFKIRQILGIDSASNLSAMASYWVYFLIHSLGFIAPGGRLAMVLPGSFVHSDYSEGVRRTVFEAFERVALVLIRERLFRDAQESTVLLLAKGRGERNREVRIGVASSKEDVREVCNDIKRNTRIVEANSGRFDLLKALISPSALQTYEDLERDNRVIRLGQVADIRIGTVTGCNRFFTISDTTRRKIGLASRYTIPIVTRASLLDGLAYRIRDYEGHKKSGARSILINLDIKSPINPLLQNYLKCAKKQRIHARYKCKKRTPWYSVSSVNIPDAFLHYMSAKAPRIVLNGADATCTNTIHALFWKNGKSIKEAKSLSLASANTLFQLSAELEGRSYGGGVLKVEPTEAKHLLLVFPSHCSSDMTSHFSQVDTLLRCGNAEGALEFINNITLEKRLGLLPSQIAALHDACEFLRRIRLRPLSTLSD